MSMAEFPKNIPVIPPVKKNETRPIENNIPRSKADVTAPECGYIVKDLHGRGHCDDQRKQHEDGAEERIHTRYKHVVRPHT
jgi:hypothetical protein